MRRLAFFLAAGLVLAAGLTASSQPAEAARKLTCAQAQQILRNNGYEIVFVQDCVGRIYVFSCTKGEAVLVYFNARTGRWRDVYGGD